jgi:hypothetical protein
MGKKQNALSGEAQSALGSPPPELPNYICILWPVGRSVNITFVMAVGGKMAAWNTHESNHSEVTRALAPWPGDESFCGGTGVSPV